MRSTAHLYICLLPFLWSVHLHAEQLLVKINIQPTALEQPSDYFVTLLQMALEESKAPDEKIELKFAAYEQSQARWIYRLQHDSGDTVIWTMTSRERENVLRPIRIPLVKGLFGKRVFIIRTQDQERFDQITSREQLGKFLAGQGIHWPDTPILQANDLPVTTAATTESLFRMLKAKRFDYFPRGVSEAWFELAQRGADTDLMVEKNLLISYVAPIYYFVHKDNLVLAQRIEQGLERMIDNGKFDEFFYSHLRTREGLEQLGLHPRRVIHLENSALPAETPVDNPRYWLALPSVKSL